jgi:hypothetical protein
MFFNPNGPDEIFKAGEMAPIPMSNMVLTWGHKKIGEKGQARPRKGEISRGIYFLFYYVTFKVPTIISDGETF